MGMALTVPRYTVDDLDRFPDDGNRYELLDGMLLVTPQARQVHNLVAVRLAVALSRALRDVARVLSPGVLLHANTTQLEPDLLVYPSRFPANCHWTDITEHWLAVEVISPSSRIYDREFKHDAYLRLGVHAVWIVDIDGLAIEVTDAMGTRTFREQLRSQLATDVSVDIDLHEVFQGLQ